MLSMWLLCIFKQRLHWAVTFKPSIYKKNENSTLAVYNIIAMVIRQHMTVCEDGWLPDFKVYTISHVCLVDDNIPDHGPVVMIGCYLVSYTVLLSVVMIDCYLVLYTVLVSVSVTNNSAILMNMVSWNVSQFFTCCGFRV